MKKAFSTDSNNNTALIARIVLGIVVFSRCSKLFGWFGGYGFEQTYPTQIGLK